MICEACHGRQSFPPCPECGGCGIAHCCDGLMECSPGANRDPAGALVKTMTAQNPKSASPDGVDSSS